MAQTFTVVVNDVREEGYPEPDGRQRTLFLFDGTWYDGWPLSDDYTTDDEGLLLWEADEGGRKVGVRYWMLTPDVLVS